MKKVLYILIFLMVAVSIETVSQNYVGKHKDDILSLMKMNYRNFKLNKDVINNTYNYLKYEDNIAEQTLLFFLSEDNYCTLVRWISDYANINEMLLMLNKKYTKAGKNTWTYTENNNNYIIRLEEGEWYFTVSYKLKI